MFRRYEKASREELNLGKCHGLLLGPWQNCTSLPVDFRWSSGHIVTLGSRVSNDGGKDWGPRIAKLEATLQFWQDPKLSFGGQAVIVNLSGLSIFWYLANIVTIPNNII